MSDLTGKARLRVSLDAQAAMLANLPEDIRFTEFRTIGYGEETQLQIQADSLPDAGLIRDAVPGTEWLEEPVREMAEFRLHTWVGQWMGVTVRLVACVDRSQVEGGEPRG